jgi:hypothetical protein
VYLSIPTDTVIYVTIYWLRAVCSWYSWNWLHFRANIHSTLQNVTIHLSWLVLVNGFHQLLPTRMVGCVQGYIPEGHLSLFTSFNSDVHIMLSSFASEASGFIFHCEQRKHLRHYKSSSNNVASRHTLLRKFCDTWNKRQSCHRARHDLVGEDEIWLHSFPTSTLGETSGPVHRVLHMGSEAVWWPQLVWAFW